jgi:hypothetical protein
LKSKDLVTTLGLVNHQNEREIRLLFPDLLHVIVLRDLSPVLFVFVKPRLSSLGLIAKTKRGEHAEIA